jgi:hypothetical protein
MRRAGRWTIHIRKEPEKKEDSAVKYTRRERETDWKRNIFKWTQLSTTAPSSRICFSSR